MTARAGNFLVVLLTLALLSGGCSIWPSNWRIGGTPLEREERKEKKETGARSDVLDGAQEAVHKAAMALEEAAPSRPVVVATDFVAEAQALLDQAQGAPKAGDVARWQSLVNRLLSENASVRQAAEKEREKDREHIADLAEKLADATAEKVKAQQQVKEYARENERLADWVKRAIWIGIGLAVLWVGSQVLSLAARFNPALAPFAALANSVAAPAVQFVANRAQEGLRRVGRGMDAIRATLGDKAEDFIRANFDSNTDDDHQRWIAAGSRNRLT
jgi:hypothetical protein